ncbi:leucine--tRNA ligase [Sesbania bispinosa]|nr:leucine--tRNA ligase [Sesbania bispinosa]
MGNRKRMPAFGVKRNDVRVVGTRKTMEEEKGMTKLAPTPVIGGQAAVAAMAKMKGKGRDERDERRR